ncbi:putative riboflavin biosynthesis protein Rib7 [Lophium mytilinum]|uniref:2,5-diamino-6-ribosylamino-4(3H)-pyrimidinone 5'-phosphate reductase n=1 Tax=Lophium mytilinum TaxID=390894 RepID=A0A6A6Q806_9PEZI|nr:putative riboflavin biosynthesis protein Rib7 [Lophium mytilinum]
MADNSQPVPRGPPTGSLVFPGALRDRLEPLLAQALIDPVAHYQHLTLTFATSLDSSIALAPGTQTALSGGMTKGMTHYLRFKHDAIVVGVGTAVADDPGLNCRLRDAGGYGGKGLRGQPRPIVLDPKCRWQFSASSKVMDLAAQKKGKAPYIICTKEPPEDRRALLESLGGKFIILDPFSDDGKLPWKQILHALRREGLNRIMVEGGRTIINDLLEPQNHELVDSIIVTIAPVWLGQGGVVVSPPQRSDDNGQPIAAVRVSDSKWEIFGKDVVLFGKPT